MNAEAFRKHLENDIIPFWNKMEDTENGGFTGTPTRREIPIKTASRAVS